MNDKLFFQNITKYKGLLNYYIHIFAITVRLIKIMTTALLLYTLRCKRQCKKVALKKVNRVR